MTNGAVMPGITCNVPMPYWLIYTRCDGCEIESCLQCRKEDRSLTLRAVEAEDIPANTLNGPCAGPEEILKRMGQFFGFDETTGRLYFKVHPNEP